MHNVECKLELRDPAIARAAILRLGGAHAGTLVQTDTYFRVPTGRLKKRETVGEPDQWIRYDRINRLEPRLSHFDLFDERTAIERFGSRPLPVLCVVRKTRELYTADHVRIHLDDVEGLGRFIEFEALVSRTNNVVKCHAAVRRLREAMGPALGEPISLSYSDMVMPADES
ncbi:MAG: CYTH domain-containing protein [Phycisphaerales bacterium]|nr:MAG: CYTH domain-containing protein [Phycisphaerales bacterium]